jgi:glycosyltransferase involved in cell wall biosynthesis
LKIVFFTFYYPPDLCAGSFRAISLAKFLSNRLSVNDELHIITTHPNRYQNHRVKADNIEIDGKVTVHRISVPGHKSGMLSQARTFAVYALAAYKLCKNLGPNFIIGTTSRLMTGVLTGISARRLGCRYFIDLRDIFSETISDLLSRKSKLLGFVSKSTFSFLEKWLFNKASGVNVVSEGFPRYFRDKGIDTSDWLFFPNGVDREFIDLSSIEKNRQNSVKTILYAGNIGSGQGLEIILPHIAKLIGNKYRFLIVGDGSTNSLLRSAIKSENVKNIEILPPVKREKLIEYYQDADILFLHLNDIPAFRRVLPSKIFEYAALGKPIVAGLSGYSAQFLSDHVPYACLFNPGDAVGAESCILEAINIDISEKAVEGFIKIYSREYIMDKMANQLMTIMDDSK